jgi:DNA-binding transcriptional LysR family regulator
MKWIDRIGQRLRLNDLHVFLTVAEAGSMVKAAERLAISQPAVSKAIADLEHTIGRRLLDRTPQGVEVTAYGRALFKRGISAFDELRQGVKDIEFLTSATAGEVMVGCSEFIAAGFLTQVIDSFSRSYPSVIVSVFAARNMWPECSLLRDRNVDLLIGRVTNPFAAEDLDINVAFEDRLFVVSGEKNRWARRRRIELSELAFEQWLLSPDAAFTQMLEEAFEACDLQPPEASVKTYSIHQRISLLRTQRFVSALAGSVVRFNAEPFSLRVLPVHFPARPWPVAIIKLKNRTVSPIVDRFIGCIQEVGLMFRQKIM